MPSLIDLRRRIRSVRNTQQVTKAMKMVSAAKLRRAQGRVLAARPYASMFGRVLADVASAVAQDERLPSHPLLARRPENRILLVLLTADRGLAGAFNTNLIKASQQFLEQRAGPPSSWTWWGARGGTSTGSERPSSWASTWASPRRSSIRMPRRLPAW